MKGKATIVATGNIHLCDNLDYADADSMLGLVALGKYDEDGDLVSGGNVYFGDPTTGTLYICAAMMFAANNFLYNSMAIDTFEAEPESGFIIKGSIAALNQVSIERDWYTVTPGDTGSAKRPARYDRATGKWYDCGTGVELTSAQVSTLRHYQMVINYDDRVRSQATQPPGLPRGKGTIFEKLTNWEELP
jgi:roadblock/LC7 domain-containing protein